MIIFTQSNYITEVVDVVNGQLQPILSDRLKYSTESVSTTIYMADKIGIDQILRLAELYKNAKEVTAPTAMIIMVLSTHHPFAPSLFMFFGRSYSKNTTKKQQSRNSQRKLRRHLWTFR